MMSPPVLLLAFNRPEATRAVLDALRRVQPGHVYFAVDGPRAGRIDEVGSVAAVQALAGSIDWPCRISTLFRDTNLGCKRAVSEAITWFFSEVEAGIILEDDCVPDPSFFPFCAELLARFADDERVAMISGDNFQFGRQRTGYSYYFSHFPHIWGWATWRRAWAGYDHGMTIWPEIRDGDWLLDIFGSERSVRFWRSVLDDTHADRNSSWAYRWAFALWVNHRLVVLPNVNLVTNIGVGAGATNTVARRNPFVALPALELGFPLRHPPYVVRDTAADRRTERSMFLGEPLWRRVARRVTASLEAA